MFVLDVCVGKTTNLETRDDSVDVHLFRLNVVLHVVVVIGKALVVHRVQNRNRNALFAARDVPKTTTTKTTSTTTTVLKIFTSENPN